MAFKNCSLVKNLVRNNFKIPNDKEQGNEQIG